MRRGGAGGRKEGLPLHFHLLLLGKFVFGDSARSHRGVDSARGMCEQRPSAAEAWDLVLGDSRSHGLTADWVPFGAGSTEGTHLSEPLRINSAAVMPSSQAHPISQS